ncbi:MAG: DUF502 domain-containing protein [Parachlamydiaceae bacterium]
MKKDFFAGLSLILPIVITLLIVQLLFRLLSAPFEGLTQPLMAWISSFPKLASYSTELVHFASQLLILILLIATTIFVGFLGKIFLVDALFKLGDRLVHKIPFANKIYKAVQDVIHNLMSEEKMSFSRVVLAPFPYAESKVIGFITKDQEPFIGDLSPKKKMAVFIPGTPNPMMGFILLIPEDQLIFTELKVEEAVKFIVSCGVVAPKAS